MGESTFHVDPINESLEQALQYAMSLAITQAQEQGADRPLKQGVSSFVQWAAQTFMRLTLEMGEHGDMPDGIPLGHPAHMALMLEFIPGVVDGLSAVFAVHDPMGAGDEHLVKAFTAIMREEVPLIRAAARENGIVTFEKGATEKRGMH